jgi:hypothetical protein
MVIVSTALRHDVEIDGACDRFVRAARLVLVDHRRPLAVVPHPRHQILDPRTGRRGESVPRVPKIMKVQAFGPYRRDRLRPGRHLEGYSRFLPEVQTNNG